MTNKRERSVWQFIDSSSVGGAERHVATLVDSLRRHGQPTLAVLLQDHALQDHGANPWLQQLAAADLPYRHLDGRLPSLIRTLRAEQPCLLHTHGYKAGILGRLAAKLAHIPVVSTFHSGERGPFPVGVYETLDDWTSRLGQRIAVSDKIRQRLPRGTHLIPSYVATPAAAPTSPLPSVVGFVGRFSPEKGPDDFCALAALAAADARFNHVRWAMWGEGPMRAYLESAYGRHITFHGVATDMDQVWPQIGLLAMPSHFEGVPLAALEAAANGIPILASRVGGLPSVVMDQQTGWLFPPGDLSAAMAGLARWQAARTTGSAALRRACWSKASTDFSEARWLPEVLKVYRNAGAKLSLPAL